MKKDICVNKRAKFDYYIEESFEAGLVLQGSEIKSLRNGKASFQDSYVSFRNGEAFLKGLHISEYSFANINNHDEDRDRKLLLHKREIVKLATKSKLQGYSVIPLKLYLKQGLAKVEIALARGKNVHDKRESAKVRDMKREAQKALRY